MLSNALLTIAAYTIDKYYGELPLRHPVYFIGDIATFFMRFLYKKSVLAGFAFVCCVIASVWSVVYGIEWALAQLPTAVSFVCNALFASTFVAHRMLKEEVMKVVSLKTPEEKRSHIATLVSRDTDTLEESDIYKAAVETYAENLNDGVIAPLLYLSIFGIGGMVVYKTINTLDSMVGYRNERFEKFGKVAARLDDVVNYIPARCTAVAIMLRGKKRPVFAFYRYGKLHDSPNAGHPIAAMALVLGIRLGGACRYFSKLRKKPYFGEGRNTVTADDVRRAVEVL